MVEDKKKEGTIMFLNMIQQASWNDASKTGSFSANVGNPEKSCAVMFNLTECGEMIAAFNYRTPKNFYHKTESRTVSITLSPWDKTGKIRTKDGEQEYPVNAFGLKVTIDGAKIFSLPLEPGEIENIKALITQGMMRNYGKAEEYAKRLEVADDVKEDTVSQ
jgi:hypothetical protein